jgi:hypothetical protein
MRTRLLGSLARNLLFATPLQAASTATLSALDFPVFVSSRENPNDFSVFANSGWDGNWFVGYNSCWILKLPPIPAGQYTRAYLGARLGRMKVLPPEGRPPQFRPVPGTLFMAIASTAAWPADRATPLATTAEIPLEGHSEYPMEGAAESRWLWTPIPLSQINFSGDNFVVLYSTSPALVNIASSPVLAAAVGGQNPGTWLVNDCKGHPPTKPQATPGTPLSFFQPALALKLIPAGPAHPLRVRLLFWREAETPGGKPVISAAVEGDSVSGVWLEYQTSKGWTAVGAVQTHAPYVFTVDPKSLSGPRARLRVVAANIWEERTLSSPFEVNLPKQ